MIKWFKNKKNKNLKVKKETLYSFDIKISKRDYISHITKIIHKQERDYIFSNALKSYYRPIFYKEKDLEYEIDILYNLLNKFQKLFTSDLTFIIYCKKNKSYVNNMSEYEFVHGFLNNKKAIENELFLNYYKDNPLFNSLHNSLFYFLIKHQKPENKIIEKFTFKMSDKNLNKEQKVFNINSVEITKEELSKIIYLLLEEDTMQYVKLGEKLNELLE